MKSKSYYITVLFSLFLAAIIFLIDFTTNWHSSGAVFSVLLMIYLSWQAIKKFKERNDDILFNYKRLFAGISLMLLIAGILIFAGTILKPKPRTQTQKERLIVK
ncbi:MAG: hypothetical protein ACMG51_04940 [Ginsengibacter sp.]